MVFLYMRLFEHFGSGIPRVIDMVKSYGLREPEYIDMEVGVRVNFYRPSEEIRQEIRQAAATQGIVDVFCMMSTSCE